MRKSVLPDAATELSIGDAMACEIDGLRIALFRTESGYAAIEASCPHRGGALADGTFVNDVVTCPLHGWQFEVHSGKCLSHPNRSIRTFPVTVESNSIAIELPEPSRLDCDTQYLVRFGVMGHVGRFRAESEQAYTRGSRVVVRSSRGVEIGELLVAANAESPLIQGQPDAGEVLRKMTDDDRIKEELMQKGQQLAFAACQNLLAERGISVQLVDAEQLFDGETLIFYFLGEPPAALADITNELAGRYEPHVQFRPVGADADGPCGIGCGKGDGHDCGHEGGGCGTGGCA